MNIKLSIDPDRLSSLSAESFSGLIPRYKIPQDSVANEALKHWQSLLRGGNT